MKQKPTTRNTLLLAFNDYIKRAQESGELPESVHLDVSKIRRVLDCWTVPWFPTKISQQRKRRRVFCGYLVWHSLTQTAGRINRPPGEGTIRRWRESLGIVGGSNPTTFSNASPAGTPAGTSAGAIKYWALRKFLEAQGIQLPLGSETQVRGLMTDPAYSELVSTPAAIHVLSELWGARIVQVRDGRTISLEIFPYHPPEQLTTEYSALVAARDFIEGSISIVGRCSLLEKRVYYPTTEGDIEESTFVAVDAEGVWYTVQGDMAYFLACDVESALTALFIHPSDRSRLLPFLVPLG